MKSSFWKGKIMMNAEPFEKKGTSKILYGENAGSLFDNDLNSTNHFPGYPTQITGEKMKF